MIVSKLASQNTTRHDLRCCIDLRLPPCVEQRNLRPWQKCHPASRQRKTEATAVPLVGKRGAQIEERLPKEVLKYI